VIFVSYQLFTRTIYRGNFVRQLTTKHVLKSCLMFIYWVLYGSCGHSYFYNCLPSCLFVTTIFFFFAMKERISALRFLYIIVFKGIYIYDNEQVFYRIHLRN
jgi:hypothetical protein